MDIPFLDLCITSDSAFQMVSDSDICYSSTAEQGWKRILPGIILVEGKAFAGRIRKHMSKPDHNMVWAAESKGLQLLRFSS